MSKSKVRRLRFIGRCRDMSETALKRQNPPECFIHEFRFTLTMCPFMGRRRRSRYRAFRRPPRRHHRTSSRINCKHGSSRPTTGSPWSSSAAKRRWWRSGSDKKLPATGWSIHAVPFGEFSCSSPLLIAPSISDDVDIFTDNNKQNSRKKFRRQKIDFAFIVSFVVPFSVISKHSPGGKQAKKSSSTRSRCGASRKWPGRSEIFCSNKFAVCEKFE